MKHILSIKFYRVAALVGIMGWAWLLLQLWAPPHSADLTVCWVKRLTGLPCPGCGITRSIVAILTGRSADALELNILGYPALLALVLLPVWLIADVSRGRTSLYNRYITFEGCVKKRSVLLWLLLMPIIANWIWDVYKHL